MVLGGSIGICMIISPFLVRSCKDWREWGECGERNISYAARYDDINKVGVVRVRMCGVVYLGSGIWSLSPVYNYFFTMDVFLWAWPGLLNSSPSTLGCRGNRHHNGETDKARYDHIEQSGISTPSYFNSKTDIRP